MYTNFEFVDVNQALPVLLEHLIGADEVGSRAGRTKEMTHVGITLIDPTSREILLPNRRPNLAAQIAETVWVLAGHDDIGWLGNYLPRAKDFSDDGMTWRAGYGRRLRAWPRRDGSSDTIDQIRWVFDHLKNNPSSRQAVASIWDPVIDTSPGKDIPCNDWLNFSSRLGKLDLHVALRSNDVIWGWSGINQFEWSSLLEIMAGLLGLRVGSLHFSTTSFHIYDRHWDKAKRMTAPGQRLVPFTEQSPRFDASRLVSRDIDGLDSALSLWLQIEQGIRHGEDMTDQVDNFPEPMLRSWLQVLQWWWSGDRDYLDDLRGTALEAATYFSVQPPERQFKWSEPQAFASDFIKAAIALHDEKHAAYGDSWRKRGEIFSILPNIARKVDRLGGSETADETSADTAMDLMIYLAKYLVFLQHGNTTSPKRANDLLLEVDRDARNDDPAVDREATEAYLKDAFEQLLVRAEKQKERTDLVREMLWESHRLARHLVEQVTEDEYRGADHD